MKRIIIHWSAGGYYPNTAETNCYHFLIDKDGQVIKGKFSPECNLQCLPGKYAPHTGGGNTASIGVALCAMYGFKDKNNCGHYPITPSQFESAMDLCAKLAKKYSIPITSNTVMTHYEFGIKHPNTTSAGKIDITYIPPYPWVDKNDCGAFIRSKIKWYLKKQSNEV